MNEIAMGMRTARPTRDLARTRRFYEELVGLGVIAEFTDHDGYDGVIFGVPDERAQLEIIHPPHPVIPQPTIEDTLVIYAPGHVLDAIAHRLRMAEAIEIVHDAPDLNPYWGHTGALCFVDPDGYRLILAMH